MSLAFAPAPRPSASGWSARLELGFEARGAQTFLAHRRHEGPLQVQRPLHPEGPSPCHVLLLHPPGGLVSGDELTVEIDVRAGASALVTAPAATKVYRARESGPRARQVQRLRLAPGAALEWLPQETILFGGARVALETRVELSPGARFLGWEIICFGRPAAGDAFATGECWQAVELWREGTPLLVERTSLAGGSEPTRAAWGLGGRSVLGALFAAPADEALLALARAGAPPARASATLVDETLVCRFLGDHAADARAHFTEIWARLRPALFGRVGQPPRIWAT